MAMADRVPGAYEELIGRARQLGVLVSCSALLGWDEQTYMPKGGSAHRGEQMACLAGLHHERATDPRLGELLASIEGSALVADPDSGGSRRGAMPTSAASAPGWTGC
jgi:carboxypeptidase Taq